MKYVKSKKSSDLKLEGIEIESEFVDGNLALLILKDKAGHVIRLERESSYNSIVLSIPAPPEIKEVWVVSGTINNVAIQDKTFNKEYEASDFIRDHRHDDETKLVITKQSVVVPD